LHNFSRLTAVPRSPETVEELAQDPNKDAFIIVCRDRVFGLAAIPFFQTVEHYYPGAVLQLSLLL